MQEEIWAPVQDFPQYVVSTHGRVKNAVTDYILTPRPGSYGHLRVSLRRDGKTVEQYIHLLVAKAFSSAWRWGNTVYHYDEDKTNNHVNNLRFRKGRRMGYILRDHPPLKIRRIKINETGEVFRTVEDCARHIQGDRSTVYSVLRGERLSHKGYSFEYIWEEIRGHV